MVEVLLGTQIVDIACGGSHSAAITSAGELYTWGKGRYGRLGLFHFCILGSFLLCFYCVNVPKMLRFHTIERNVKLCIILCCNL